MYHEHPVAPSNFREMRKIKHKLSDFLTRCLVSGKHSGDVAFSFAHGHHSCHMAHFVDDRPSTATSEPLPGARSALTLLLLINLFNYIDRQVLAAVEHDIAKDFFKDPKSAMAMAKMGSLASAFFFTYMLTAPIFGWLADRVSRWLLVGIGVLLWSAATGATGLATSFGFLMASRLFVGIGEAGYGPSAPTIIADLYPVARRGSVLAWFYVAIPVGSALGYVIGGAVGARFGWRWAFYVVTIPGILLGIWSLTRKDTQRGRADGVDPAIIPAKPTVKDYLALVRIKSYVLNTAAMAAMTFAIGGIAYWMPRYLIDVRGLSEGKANSIFGGIVVVNGLFATLAGGRAGDKLRDYFSGAYFLVSAVGMLLACPFMLLMLHVSFPMTWVMLSFAVFFLFFNTGPSNTALANVTHPSVRASAFALNIFAIHLFGDVPSPTVLGYTAGKFGWDAAFGVVAAIMVLASLLWFWGMKYLDADTAAAPTSLNAPGV
jgi:MFS transporter, Spinster family, sphingosine-1-phosphate transporter